MAHAHLRRGVVAIAASAALLASASPASAQFFSFSSGTPAPPGELDGGSVLLLMLAGTAATTPMVYAGVVATTTHRPTKSKTGYIGLTIGGGALSVLGSVYLPFVERGSPSFAFTLVTGLFYSMAGVGIGGLAGPSDLTAPWLGGSAGLGTAAVYRGILSLAGQDDYHGGAAAQATLGLLGGLGCALEAIYERKTDRGIALGCTGVSLLAAGHGFILLSRPEKPRDPATKTAHVRALPVPWFQPSAAGVVVAGVF